MSVGIVKFFKKENFDSGASGVFVSVQASRHDFGVVQNEDVIFVEEGSDI